MFYLFYDIDFYVTKIRRNFLMAINSETFINREKLVESLSRCMQCGDCIEVCCTSYTSNDENLSPMGRLGILTDFFEKGSISDSNLEAIYLCTECGRCETVCPAEIPISGVIADSKIALSNSGHGPLDKHIAMIEAIKKNTNAVTGNPANRLDWIPEKYRDKVKFEDSEGDTLLYLGCLSSFLDKKTAAASLDILMSAGVDFKLLREEFCCGIYPYNAGKIDEAENIFLQMQEKFEKAGIKKIIVPCAGCHRAFSSYYPRLLKNFNLKIVHIAEVIAELIEQKKLNLISNNTAITFHDACKTGRKAGLYDLPRKVLSRCGYNITELDDNRENAICCGSGSGVRSINRNLSMDIAAKIIFQAKSPLIASTCPFCIFNFNYTAHKKEAGKKAEHIAVLVQACLMSS
jgi:Fe-S oxidoreductase